MKRQAILLLAALPGACCNVQATEVDPADSIQVKTLQTVEVTATRADTNTPVAFTNVSAPQLSTINTGVDMPYLLQFTPSVITTSDGGAGTGYTSIRVRGTDSSRINVTANNIPINDSESHNVYWVNLPDLTSSVQDVQVQRGVGTSTNGAGAFGASVNMVTSRPSSTPYGEVAASYGMYNTNKQTLRLGTGMLSDAWTIDARISHIGTDGYIDRAWAKMWSYMGQVAWYHGPTSLRALAFGGKQRTYMAWDYATLEDMETYGRRFNPCGKYTASDGQMAFYPDQVDNYTQHNFQLILTHAFTTRLKLDAALHYTPGNGYYEQYKTKRDLVSYGLTPYVDADGNKVSRSDLVRLKNMKNDFYGTVFSLHWTPSRLSAILGGGASRYRGHHFGQVAWVRNYLGAINPLQEYYRNLGEKFDANIYARANVDIYRGLSAYADMQYRHIDYSITGISDNFDWNDYQMQKLDIHRHYNFFNPKGGLNWKISESQRAYASVSVAHKEPTRDTFLDNGPLQQPVAERLTDYEIGYEYRSGILGASVNVYYMRYHNQLVPTGQLSDTGNAVNVNVPHSYRLGAEFVLQVKPASWFDWDFTATLSRNRVKDFHEYIYDDDDWSYSNPLILDLGDTPLAFSPSLTFHNSLNFNVARFDASLQSHYVGRQYMTNSGNDASLLKAYFVSDLHLGYNFRCRGAVKECRLGFTIYNIFNTKYFNNGYAGAGYYVDGSGDKQIYRYAAYSAQAPAHVMASVTVKF